MKIYLLTLSTLIASFFLVSCGPSAMELELQEEVSKLEADLSSAYSELETMGEAFTNIELQRDDLLAQIQELEDDLSDARGSLASYRRVTSDLVCQRQITNMSYNSILETTSKLEAYVNGLPGVAYTAGGYRDSIYGNTDSKIHMIRYYDDNGDQYGMSFLVYYNELDWTPSTFSIDNQCWIDPPVRMP